MSTPLSFCQWLAETPFSTGIRESTYVYPIIESVHVLSLCVFVGLLLSWDLRLLGITLRRVAVSEVWARLIPWITMGAVLMVLSGLLLFASDPVRFFGNIFFRIKALGLFLALLNAMAFHLGIERKLVDWDTAVVTPRAAKLAGAISIGLWAVIVVTGRFVAYNWFSPLV
jgi:energy-coupling factor transporter transmembrane protein EcfT